MRVYIWLLCVLQHCRGWAGPIQGCTLSFRKSWSAKYEVIRNFFFLLANLAQLHGAPEVPQTGRESGYASWCEYSHDIPRALDATTFCIVG